MGSFSMGPPANLSVALRDALKLECFVETGTLDGGTSVWAADQFSSVITIEASKYYFDKTYPLLEKFQNIDPMFGDSGRVLSSIVSGLPPSMFFLDAHWSGGNTEGKASECPLLTEISVIMPWFRKHVILVDDARLFLQPPPIPHKIDQWPSLDDIFRATNGAAYIAHYKDVLILVPNIHRTLVSEALRQLSD